MTARYLIFLLAMSLVSLPIYGDDQDWNAALGGALGGGLGAYLGNELGGRNGAIIGGALGGAAGAVISTERYDDGRRWKDADAHPGQRRPPGLSRDFCPPGLAKQGRC